MTEIVLKDLGRDFGDFVALSDMNLTIADGEFVALLGPSGCGKSTTMNMVAGMLAPSRGEIRFDGQLVHDVPMQKRGVGFVSQNYAIFTHRTVRGNLAYGLKAQGQPPAEIRRRVDDMAELLQLGPMLDRRAGGLSVNILQRIAIGRSAIVEPAIFLLDEPLSNVDAVFRATMRSELKALQRRFRQTMIYVTHDQLEAMTMADRIAVMDHGKLLQVGTPLEVYNHPNDTFVAGFIGSPGMNLLPARGMGGDRPAADLGPCGVIPLPFRAGGELTFGFRPETVHPDDAGPLAMEVDIIERIGARTILHLRAGDRRVNAILDAETPVPAQGGILRFRIDPADMRLFDPSTGRAIREPR